MSMRTPLAPLLLAAMVAVPTPHRVLGKQAKSIHSWPAAGVGRSSLGFAARSAALSLQVNHLLFSARFIGDSSAALGGEEYEDLGWPVENVRMSLAAGLGWGRGAELQGSWFRLSGEQGQWLQRGAALGFPVEIQVSYPPRRFVGLGASAFCDLNVLKHFSGVTVTFIMGKLH
ncbi:MAG: hypothetical protein H5U38_08160 [Calditrichaeota bacterium]|nr:hypothetical protein [Calditrichota bacterium]